MKTNCYDVMVYYGTMTILLPYAKDCTWRDAQTLLQLAIGLGYTDAKIVEQKGSRR